MKYNYLRKLILLIFPLFLYSCGSIKDGFTNQKKASSDEFLVEKKSPLVMPPDYDQLPIPNLDDNNYVSEDGKIKKLLKKSNINAESEASENSGNLEDSLIDKIKNN